MIRRLRCLFRRHQWRSEYDHATKRTKWECLRCGAYKVDVHDRDLNPGELGGGGTASGGL